MINEGKFGSVEAISLASIMIITKVFYTSPATLVQKEGTAVWYGSLISCIVTLISFYFFYILMKRFPSKNIIQIFDVILGRFLGKTLGLFYAVFSVYYCASNLREFCEMIKAYIMPYTPISLLFVAMFLAALLLSYFGLETIARVSATGLIPVLLGLVTILLLAIPHYEMAFLKPYWGYGLKTTFTYGVLRSSAFLEFAILPVFILSMHNIKTFKNAGIISILLSGAVLSISMLCYLLTFGYSQGSENMAGLFELSKSIYINRFIERVESIFLFSWVIASVITVAISFYIAISIYCTAFEIKNHRPLLLPFAFLTFTVAILPKNVSDVIDINLLFIRQYSVFFIHTIPFVMLLIAMIRKKKGVMPLVEKS